MRGRSQKNRCGVCALIPMWRCMRIHQWLSRLRHCMFPPILIVFELARFTLHLFFPTFLGRRFPLMHGFTAFHLWNLWNIMCICRV
jgi:hypothetical protein